MLLAFMLPIGIIFLLNFQLVVLGFDNSLFVYLLLCVGNCGLAIMINKGLLEETEKKKNRCVLCEKEATKICGLCQKAFCEKHYREHKIKEIR